MSGCPSACAMTYTGDIGLKGVKIRRRLRVIDAFDVYLGGGLANEVEMGILYQKGVPFDQLPEFLEKIIRDFYLRREEMETFSQYWRNKLTGHNAEPLKQELPSWRCSRCHHMHVGEDPPPFCPVCAALRAKFEPAPEETEDSTPPRDTAPKVEPATKVDAVSPEAASSLNWTCSSCGLKHAGQEAPELCPVCGAKKADFRRLGSPGSVATAPLGKPSGKRILIVGGSIAGHTAAHTARSLDPAAQITIISDERYSFYNRLNLTRFLSGEVQLAELFDYPPAWYDEKQIEVLTERRIISLDPIKKTTLLDEGRELPYDACILAHGSRANTPSFYRAELAGVYLLRTLDDVERIISYTCQGTRIAVVGGGVLGLEAAYGLVKRGASVKVFEYLPYLMPRQLDKTGAEILGDQVRALGIESNVGVEVKELLGTERVEGLMLGDGRRFDADIVIVSTGIKPNIEWVKQSGIHCSRGVLVDDSMQTSAEDVYAVGDVAEWQGQVVGLWTNAIEQAKVAATNAVGKMALFQGFLPVTILKCLGIPLVSIGEIEEDGDGIASSISYDEAAGIYRRIILRDGVPIGGILLGTSSGMGDLRKLIESGAELDRMKRKIIAREEGRGAIAYS